MHGGFEVKFDTPYGKLSQNEYSQSTTYTYGRSGLNDLCMVESPDAQSEAQLLMHRWVCLKSHTHNKHYFCRSIPEGVMGSKLPGLGFVSPAIFSNSPAVQPAPEREQAASRLTPFTCTGLHHNEKL